MIQNSRLAMPNFTDPWNAALYSPIHWSQDADKKMRHCIIIIPKTMPKCVPTIEGGKFNGIIVWKSEVLHPSQ